MDCKLVQLINVEGDPCSVALVQSPAGYKHLVVNQLHTQLLQGACSSRSWQRKLQEAAGRARQPFKKAGLLLKAKLVSLGAVSSRGVSRLVSVHYCTKATKAMGLPHALVSSMAALQSNQGVLLQQATDELMAQNAVGSTCPSTFRFAAALPIALDPAASPQLRSRERLALNLMKPSLASSSVVAMQLQNLKEHSQLALVVGRQGRAVKSVTWTDIHKEIMLYLGYIHIHLGVVHPNLEHYTRADFIAAYCCSKGNRGDKGTSICNGIYVAKRVVLFWKARCPAEVPRLSELMTWMEGLCSQVRQAWPSQKRNVSQLLAAGKWAHAPQLIKLFEEKRSEAMHAFQHLPTLSMDQARSLHDVAMACLMFGWIPPPRCSCVRTLCPPRHRGPCPDPDCRSGACWGNRVHVKDEYTFKLHLPHHKAQLKWGTIEFDLPVELTSLLHLYLVKGYAVLKAGLEVQHPFMFMPFTADAFDSSTFCTYWQDLMYSWGGPVGGPHTLRHIFVTERMRASTAPGPSQVGAAFCMGHDPAQWSTSYDLQSLHRGAQEAVDAMHAWRASMLASAGGTRPAVPVLTAVPVSACVDAGVDDDSGGDDNVSGPEGPSFGSSECTPASSFDTESSGVGGEDLDSDEDDLEVDVLEGQ